jgi:uncharacterized membrane protein
VTALATEVGSVYRSASAGAATVGGLRRWRPRRGPLLVFVALVLVHALALTGQATAVRAAVGLPIAVLLPGTLALHLIGGRPRRGWEWLLHAVALSVLGLSMVALLLALLPGGGLTTVGSLLGLDALLAGLTAAVTLTMRRRGVGASAPPLTWTRPVVPPVAGLLAVGLSAIAVLLAVVGARHLNAGGGPAGVMLAIAVAVLALAAATAAATGRASTTVETTIYLVALAVLLATSLRGTGVTGHDIKVEYRVLTDTLSTGSWRPGGLFPGYNSCLSITVLPAFLARLLGTAPLDVFRVCFPILFAVLPVGVYLGARRVLPPPYAVLAAVLELAFPTFVNDMPMLNRQEIGLIFFAVLVLNLMEPGRPRRQQLIMFVAAAAGLTVSHYTSTGIAAQLLVLVWVMRRVRQLIAHRRGFRPQPPQPHRRVPGVGLPAAVLAVLAVGWPLLAGSAPAFESTLRSSLASVAAGAGVASSSTSYSFFSSPPERTDAEALNDYLDGIRQGRGLTAPAAAAVVPLPADELPRTPVGSALAAAGISPHGVNLALRGAAVVLLQGGAILGVLLIWWSARHRFLRERTAVPVLTEFGVAAVALLAVTVAVPQLSDAYGLLRLFQQLLVVLAPVVVMALAAGVHAVIRTFTEPRRWFPVTVTGTAAAVLGCLLVTSGFVPRLIGDYPPQLNLANAGPYYATYYTSAADLEAMRWLDSHLPAGSAVGADSRDTANLVSLTTLTAVEAVAPGAVPPNVYLVVRTEDGVTADAVATVGEQAIRYSFPLAGVTGGRPLLARSGIHLIYGPVTP